jgi:hypothetical protein
MKRALLFIASFVVIATACAQTNRKNDKIIYRSFPKMEEKICFEMRRFSKTDSNFFISLTSIIDGDKISFTKYAVAVVPFRRAPPEILDVIKKSNRVLPVCGKLLPVYVNHMDQVFTQEKEMANLVHSWHGHGIGIVDVVDQTVD